MNYYVCGKCKQIGRYGKHYTRYFVIEDFPYFCYREHNSDMVTGVQTFTEAQWWLEYLTGVTDVPPWKREAQS
jgi:hypothetical protein